MNDSWDRYVEREAAQDQREILDEMYDRFVPVELPSPQIQRVTLDRDETCSICRDPLFFGEVAWVCEMTHQVGCCEEHCREAAETKLTLMGTP